MEVEQRSAMPPPPPVHFTEKRANNSFLALGASPSLPDFIPMPTFEVPVIPPPTFKVPVIPPPTFEVTVYPVAFTPRTHNLRAFPRLVGAAVYADGGPERPAQ
jgi:hypothetical protein